MGWEEVGLQYTRMVWGGYTNRLAYAHTYMAEEGLVVVVNSFPIFTAHKNGDK
jgi:hypothetical protein